MLFALPAVLAVLPAVVGAAFIRPIERRLVLAAAAARRLLIGPVDNRLNVGAVLMIVFVVMMIVFAIVVAAAAMVIVMRV